MYKLKAFVKYDNNGRIVPGVLLLRTKKPSGAGWVEVPSTFAEARRQGIKSIELILPATLDVAEDATASVEVTYNTGATSILSDGFELVSSDATIVSVSGAVVTGDLEGEATVTATFQGKKDSVTIEVTSA